jgi:hypothetical protein
MVVPHVSDRLTVNELTLAVKLLSPSELLEFTQWLANWQQNGRKVDQGAALIELTKARLPAAQERQLRRLIAKSQSGTLSQKELQLYRELAQQAEQISAARTAALAELVRRRGKTRRQRDGGHRLGTPKHMLLTPQTGGMVRLFDPRRQRWSRHFVWSQDFLRLIGRSATGRATVVALQLNRPEIINLRLALRAIGEHPADSQ